MVIVASQLDEISDILQQSGCGKEMLVTYIAIRFF
jgi:hypothetical protein